LNADLDLATQINAKKMFITKFLLKNAVQLLDTVQFYIFVNVFLGLNEELPDSRISLLSSRDIFLLFKPENLFSIVFFSPFYLPGSGSATPTLYSSVGCRSVSLNFLVPISGFMPLEKSQKNKANMCTFYEVFTGGFHFCAGPELTLISCTLVMRK
jgi:hypothetical protein